MAVVDLSKHKGKTPAQHWEDNAVEGCHVPMAFPAALKFADATVEDQVTAIFSEARELAEALHEQDPMWLVELLDVHHSIETLYRILANTYGPDVLNNARARVIQKNAERGYYLDADDHKPA